MNKFLISKKNYSVFIFCSKVPFPASIFVHCWIVTNKKGKVSRWEFGKFNNKLKIHKNIFKPTQGMNIIPFVSKFRFNSKLIGSISGGEKSLAKKIILFIEKKSKEYPLKDQYNLLGPNSNTFVQWILNKNKKANLRIPWNAIGKNYFLFLSI